MILDINECLTSPCHPNAICNNAGGSYICGCDMGYTGDGFNCAGMNGMMWFNFQLRQVH